MAANLIWRPQAREDLLLIYEFIGLDNPAAAVRLFKSIEDKTTLLVRHDWVRAVPILNPAHASCSKGRTSFFTRRIPILMTVRSRKSKSSASSTVAAT
jgi:plasmid stabilization system protein ParE